MAWGSVPGILVLAIAGVTAACFSLFLRKKYTETPGGSSLVIVSACVAIWTWGSAFVLGDAQEMILAGQVMITLATIILPVSFLRFSLEYTGRSERTWDPITWGALLVVPAGTGAILFFSSISSPPGAMQYDIVSFLAFWISSIYAFCLVFAGIAFIVQVYQSAEGILRGQLTCLLVAAGVPFALHGVYLGLAMTPGIIDTAPIACIVSVIVIGIGIQRFRLFTILPVEYGEVLRQVRTGIVALDAEGRITGINGSARILLGINEQDVIGEPVRQYLTSQEIPDLPEYVADRKNLIRKKIDDQLCYIGIRSVPMHTRHGESRGSILMLTDVTDLILTGQSLNVARRNVNLLTGVTRHDILNQLTVIILHNEILKASVTDTSLARSISEQEKAAKNIRRLIEFTKDYEALGEKVPEWTNIGMLFNHHWGTFGNDKVRFSNSIADLEVFTDPLICRVVENLLDNSIRYGLKVTEIRLSAVQHLDGLIIIYDDNGVGIPVRDKTKIFQRGAGRRPGFGLFFAREILSITGIAIRESGKEGEGVRFEIIVPYGMFRIRKNRGTVV